MGGLSLTGFKFTNLPQGVCLHSGGSYLHTKAELKVAEKTAKTTSTAMMMMMMAFWDHRVYGFCEFVRFGTLFSQS